MAALPVGKGREMNAVFDVDTGNREGLSLIPRLQQPHGNCTKRMLELETIAAGLRAALEDAEAALQREKARQPEIGDFVRCPLTNFFGQVTKVTPRPYGRSWVEIIPYLAHDFRGHAAMDLYDSWELIDPPMEHMEVRPPAASSLKLPSTASFQWPSKAADEPQFADEDQKLAEDLELLMSDLLSDPKQVAR